MNTIKVLSLPSRHPYTSKFNAAEISFVNPDTDFFTDGLCNADYLEEYFPPASYDLAHIHFSFDRLSIEELKSILKYFKEKEKPVVWTLHSKESQRIKNFGEGKYQKILFEYSSKIISPTTGAAAWLEKKYGKHSRSVDVIPLGYMSDPRDIERLDTSVEKSPLLFSMLIGEFRQNKEFLQSIANFVQCSDLKDFMLQLIFKPISLYGTGEKLSNEMIFFYNLIQNPRIEILSKPEIPNEEINIAFLRSHAVVLPYKWGTHSGQIELAKDCGCHVVVSDVGYYKEQWDKVYLYQFNKNNAVDTASNYTKALIEVSKQPSLKPAGVSRLEEHYKIMKQHIKIYQSVLQDRL
jgi:beta-1,4-mannosyltransferase